MTQQTFINTYCVPGNELDPGPAAGIEGTVPALLEAADWSSSANVRIAHGFKSQWDWGKECDVPR